MRITELWRYPVKSMQGEQLDRVRIDTDGLHGDRRFALVDSETGLGLTGRRVPKLLFASARFTSDGARPEITLPDGSVTNDDGALSAWLGRNVTLVDAHDREQGRYESPDGDDENSWHVFEGPGGAFHDAEIFPRVARVNDDDWRVAGASISRKRVG